MKRLLTSIIFAVSVALVGLSAISPSSAQLIYGNTFPFWNVNGPLAVTGATTLSGGTTITGGLATAGTTAGTAATAGYVGEVLSVVNAVASATTLTTATAAGNPCVSLTAGDWDVSSNMVYSATGATFSDVAAAVNTNAASNVLPTAGDYTLNALDTTALSGASVVAVTSPVRQVNIAATTTYCGVGRATFGAGVASIYGKINARRVR